MEKKMIYPFSMWTREGEPEGKVGFEENRVLEVCKGLCGKKAPIETRCMYSIMQGTCGCQELLSRLIRMGNMPVFVYEEGKTLGKEKPKTKKRRVCPETGQRR